jgi:caffeoyl-CoA O-methyltransferase
MDINKENYELGLPVIKKAGVDHKIDFREGPALPVLDELVKDVSFTIFYFFYFSHLKNKKTFIGMINEHD